MTLARPLWIARTALFATMTLLSVAVCPVTAQASDSVSSGVSARDLQEAIDAIKRRVAEQQAARDVDGESALTVELNSAREAITELTQNLSRLRGERDELTRDLEASRATEADLAAALADSRESEAGLRTALDTTEKKATAAADELSATLEQAAVDVAERERQLSELRQLMDADASALAKLEEEFAVSEAERSRLASELPAMLQNMELLESDLAEARSIAESLTAEVSAERERAAAVGAAAVAAQAKLAEVEATERESSAQAAALENEIAELRDVARRSVAEVEELGESLLATLAENAELSTALAEARETRSVIEAELKEMRLEVEAQKTNIAGTQNEAAMPPALLSSDAMAEALDAELAAAKREIAMLTEELIARDKQLAEGAANRDVDALVQKTGLLQREVEMLGAENASLTAELAKLRDRSQPMAAEIVSTSADPVQSLDRFLTELNAVDTGDGWWMTVPEGLVFAPGSDELAAGTEPTVMQLATLVRYFDDALVRIVGHTDSFGDGEINRSLSVQRAQSVGRALVEVHGIDPSRITTEGFGEEQPIASNATIEGRRANRRVEIYIRR